MGALDLRPCCGIVGGMSRERARLAIAVAGLFGIVCLIFALAGFHVLWWSCAAMIDIVILSIRRLRRLDRAGVSGSRP